MVNPVVEYVHNVCARVASWLNPRREFERIEYRALWHSRGDRMFWYLAELYQALGLLVDAERCMRRYSALRPEDGYGHAKIAHLCLRQKRLGRALKDAERALRVDRNCWLGWAVMGTVLLRQEQWAESVRALRQAIWLSDEDCQDAEVHGLLAEAYERLGAEDRAAAHRRRSEEINAGSQENGGAKWFA